jgi:hypothetical protein
MTSSDYLNNISIGWNTSKYAGMFDSSTDQMILFSFGVHDSFIPYSNDLLYYYDNGIKYKLSFHLIL